MSDVGNQRTPAGSDRRGFAEFMRSNIYAVLSHAGVTIFVIVSSYLLVWLSEYDQQNDLFILFGLVCILLFLAYILLCPFLGLYLPVISSKVTRQNFSGCWLILLLMSAGVAAVGFLLQEGQLLYTSPPAILVPLLSNLGGFAPAFGIYLMLYGGGAFLCYAYFAVARMNWPSALLKMLLGHIIILIVVCWSTYNAWVNEDDPFLLSISCFAIQFIGMGGAVAFGLTKSHTFARSCRGRVKLAFVPLYLFDGIMAVAGILLLISGLSVHNVFVNLLDSAIHGLPQSASGELNELNHEFLRFFMGLCLLLLHGCGILGTVSTHLERCKHCGRYACNESTDTSETSRVTGTERVTETETMRVFDRYGYDEETATTTSDYKTVSGTTCYVVHCAYCGKYLDKGSYKWQYTTKTDSDFTKEHERHYWS